MEKEKEKKKEKRIKKKRKKKKEKKKPGARVSLFPLKRVRGAITTRCSNPKEERGLNNFFPSILFFSFSLFLFFSFSLFLFFSFSLFLFLCEVGVSRRVRCFCLSNNYGRTLITFTKILFQFLKLSPPQNTPPLAKQHFFTPF